MYKTIGELLAPMVINIIFAIFHTPNCTKMQIACNNHHLCKCLLTFLIIFTNGGLTQAVAQQETAMEVEGLVHFHFMKEEKPTMLVKIIGATLSSRTLMSSLISGGIALVTALDLKVIVVQ